MKFAGAPTLTYMEFDRIEALRIGQELKRIRKQRGLSLAEVESLSQGRWKAVVVGSYERADRAITVGRLSALMALYQAPVSVLFRHDPASNQEYRLEENSPIAFDLSKRTQLQQLHPGLAHYLNGVIHSRGDWNGHILSIRANDLHMAASYERISYKDFIEQLRANKLLLQWR